MDTIGDFLTIIRNAISARKCSCEVAASKMRLSIAETLKKHGYISGYVVTEVRKGVKVLSVDLKYVKGCPAITGLCRWSRPGRRLYASAERIPVIYNNLGISIVSTSKGVMSGSEAKAQKVGGELLCKVW